MHNFMHLAGTLLLKAWVDEFVELSSDDCCAVYLSTLVVIGRRGYEMTTISQRSQDFLRLSSEGSQERIRKDNVLAKNERVDDFGHHTATATVVLKSYEAWKTYYAHIWFARP